MPIPEEGAVEDITSFELCPLDHERAVPDQSRREDNIGSEGKQLPQLPGSTDKRVFLKEKGQLEGTAAAWPCQT